MWLVALLFYAIFPNFSVGDTGGSIFTKFVQSDYKMKWDAVEVLEYDKQFFKIFTASARKYNRTQVVLNITFQLAVESDDISMITKTYKLSRTSAYREFPMTIVETFCNGINSKAMGFGAAFKETNPDCLLKKGVKYHVGNFVPDERNFPPFFPSGEFKMGVIFVDGDKHVCLMEMRFTVYRPEKFLEN